MVGLDTDASDRGSDAEYTLDGLYGLADTRKRYAELYASATAASPDAEALNDLGCIWLRGSFVGSNWPLARALFIAAARLGSISAYMNLAYMHWYGKSVPVNERKSLAWYRFAARRGSIDAWFEMGHIYAASADEEVPEEVRVAQDFDRAAECLLAAASNQHVSAMFFLGDLLLDERFERRDEAKGLYWLIHAATLGDPLAAERIADFFDGARIGPPDPGNLLRNFWRDYRVRRDAVIEQ